MLACRSADDVLAAAAGLGFPLVLKGCSAAIPHKSDYDLVKIGVAGEAQARSTFEQLSDAIARLTGQRSGVIAAQYVRNRRELALGARVDPVFGVVVTIGDGGKYAEALDDVALLPVPFSAADVHDALSSLRIGRLLRAHRNEPPLDLEALCHATVRLGEIAAANAAAIVSIDVNPVLVGRRGEGVLAADAVVERSALAQQGALASRSSDAATPSSSVDGSIVR